MLIVLSDKFYSINWMKWLCSCR